MFISLKRENSRLSILVWRCTCQWFCTVRTSFLAKFVRDLVCFWGFCPGFFSVKRLRLGRSAGDTCTRFSGFFRRLSFHLWFQKELFQKLANKAKFPMPKYQLFSHRRLLRQSLEEHNQQSHKMSAFYTSVSK